MKFKNYEDYRTQREALCNAAEELLQNGDTEGANARMAEVEQMDNEYEAFATAQANLAAMQGRGTAHPDGMVDSTGQPIARVNYGIAEGETYRFGGKEVITTEEDVLESFAAASNGEVFGVFVNLNDYIINTNMQMRTDRWRDNDNNQEKVKVTLVCDGKLADPNGVLILKKKVTQ